MGNRTSKKRKEILSQIKKKVKETSAPRTLARSMHYTTELRSYEAACEADTELQSFDTCLQARTSHAISTLATGVEVRSLSFDSLKGVTECLMEMNQDVTKVILECKKETWKNQELFELVRDYLESSVKTIDFCAALEKGLRKARENQLLILIALQHFEDESLQGGNGYKKTLEELKNFKEAECPFNEDFLIMFQSVYEQQMLLLEKLELRKNKLDKKLKCIHKWRKLSSIIFVTTFATVLICSVVAAAMMAPPVAAALAAASAAPLGSMGKWIDSLWKNYENALKGQKEEIISMQAGTDVTVKDLDNIRDLIERLEMEIKGMVKCADFAVKHGAVKTKIDEIKQMLAVFKKNVDRLGRQADVCITDIKTAKTVVLRRLLNNASSST